MQIEYQFAFNDSECKTIEDMRDKGRGNRYVSSAWHDGLFEVRTYDNLTKVRGEKMEAYLQPCHNCMNALNYEKYSGMKTKAGQK